MSALETNEHIVKLLNELIDLVKKNGQNKVENHTHHHYPTQTYTYPSYHPGWTSGGTAVSPGITWTTSSNDPPNNGPANPTA